ncbi:hypothetical protein [Terrisporobacter glycolicus]|uniref:Uncharacterized protein n=1 Tax=Terrisporobacter glycolicus ATCC 14880 = DSM 1288 TaxID=1121315 RepID=A0ABZ2EW50_9FIRM|nr:hypothetical protein [Terrisporobacter glycolicus]
MKNKLNVIRYLTNSTYEELNTIEEYNNFKRVVEPERKDQTLEIGEQLADRKYFDTLWRYKSKYGEGNKQKVKDNLKMIRRITLEIEKSL